MQKPRKLLFSGDIFTTLSTFCISTIKIYQNYTVESSSCRYISSPAAKIANTGAPVSVLS